MKYSPFHILSVLALVCLVMLTAQGASAACIHDGIQTYTCSGDISGTAVVGSAGNDIFVFLNGTTGTSVTISSGGAATQDQINFSASSVSVSIDLSNQTTPQTIYAGLEILFQGFTSAFVQGSAFDDVVTGTTGADTLGGGGGDDTLNGDTGDDTITGGPGSDTIDGGAGTDTRADTSTSDCTGDTVSNVETDTCPAVPPPAPVTSGNAPVGTDLCITAHSRMAMGEHSALVIYSDFGTTPNGMIITEIPLRSLRAVTDAEKAANAWVPLIAKDSEFAPGWSVGLYWHDNHYGAVVYKDGSVFDDTGAICGWF